MSKTRGGRSWKDRQERDPYVQQARKEGWRSRAVYKLLQIDEKERLLKKGMVCVDLGAAPGGWSQYVTEKLNGAVRVVAVDLLPMDALPSVEFIQGDFTSDEVLEELKSAVGESGADLVISDMAPNISGYRAVDQPRSMYLAELALELCKDLLRPGGDFVCKLFQGEGIDPFIKEARVAFERVKVMKPKASRPGSREVYLVARNYRL
jgi:23S rRNA (uridine2552-2'-O)-methyltransferase